MLANEWGLRLLSVHQDSRVDPFGWQSMVDLLGLCEHTGMERCETLGIKHTDMFKLKNISKLTKL